MRCWSRTGTLRRMVLELRLVVPGPFRPCVPLTRPPASPHSLRLRPGSSEAPPAPSPLPPASGCHAVHPCLRGVGSRRHHTTRKVRATMQRSTQGAADWRVAVPGPDGGFSKSWGRLPHAIEVRVAAAREDEGGRGERSGCGLGDPAATRTGHRAGAHGGGDREGPAIRRGVGPPLPTSSGACKGRPPRNFLRARLVTGGTYPVPGVTRG